MPPYPRALFLAVLALAAVAVLAGAEPSGAPAVAARPGVAAYPPGPDPAGSFRSVRGWAVVADPVRLRIPALGVTTGLQRLGRQRDGSVAVPNRTDVAGWYTGGPRPGQPGPAVILGHIDSRTGPGVFVHLDELRPGAVVRVDRSEGSTVTFRVTAVSRVPKTAFPTDLVYAPTLDPTLRLVTCGGSFDRSRGSYRDNVIAYAVRT
jgi:hypothetical protein